MVCEEDNMQEKRSIEIDQKVVNRLMKKIILLEKRNIKTKEFGYGQIVKKIKTIIEEEVECY